MKFVYINTGLLPWNYSCNHLDPDLKLSGNVYIDNREWYNSFLPPFFLPEDIGELVLLRQRTDSGREADTNRLLEKNKQYFVPEKVLETLIRLTGQLNAFYDLERDIWMVVDPNSGLSSLLGAVHFSINLSGMYFFPIDGLVTRKRTIGQLLDPVVAEEAQAEVAKSTFSADSVMMPMAVMLDTDFCSGSDYLRTASRLCQILHCSPSELESSLCFLNRKFNCKRYMSTEIARKIIIRNIDKIHQEDKLKPEEKLALLLQNLSASITWSKYIPVSSGRGWFRNHLWTGILTSLLDMPEVQNVGLTEKLKVTGTSGSEKYGKLIFLLRYFMDRNPNMKTKILESSYRLSETVFTTPAAFA